VAKSLLSEYGQQFQDLNFFSTLRFLADQARAQLTELDPVTSRRTEPEHLRDGAWQLELYRHREKMLVASVARRFKRRIDDKMNSFDAMIEVQDHLVACAQAHIERVMLEKFIEGVDNCEDKDVAAQLDTLRQLFGLWHMSQDIGWFQENSLIEPMKARAIREQINQLCNEVRQQAVHLVDSFGIPDKCLGAPIAFSPVVQPKHYTEEDAAE
jgi:acyl-CoA oxidase